MNASQKAILALLLAGAALLVLRHFDLHPIRIAGAPDEDEVRGAPPEPGARGDVLLLLDAAVVAGSAATYRALDASAAWLNLLDAEFGAYSVQPPAAPLAAARAVIVSSSAQQEVAPPALAAFAAAGGSVLLDAPPLTGAWRRELLELAGLRLGDPAQLSFSEPLLPHGLLPEAHHEAFENSPLPRPRDRWNLVPDAAAGGGAGRGLAGAGAPIWFERRIGAGRMVVPALPLARLYLAMLQGEPDDDFGVDERLGDYPGIVEPDDLVGDPRRRTNEVPFADLFARALSFLLDPADAAAPALPRLLWFPAGSNGLFLMTHDEDFQGGLAAVRQIEQDQAMGLRGTVFAVAHPRMAEDWTRGHDHAAEIVARGGAVGLHWNRFAMPQGLGPVEPVAFVHSLDSQLRRLRRLSPATASTAFNRNHYLVLDNSWTGTFRKLAAAGVRLDSTFGSNKGRGYLFGTARPYRILDDNGLPLDLRELPFVHQEDWGGADAAFFDRTFERNAAHFRGALVSLFHPHLIAAEEDGARLVEHVARKAHATGHRMFHFGELLDFLAARDRATVRSRVTGGRLVIDAETGHDDLVLGLPLAPGTPRPRLEVDGLMVPVSSVLLAGRPYAVLPLLSGRHRLELEFQAP